MKSEEPEPLKPDAWRDLDTKSRICLKSLNHSMAHRYTLNGELTPLGEGVVWWLTEVYPNADYEAMVEYLEEAATDLIESLANRDDKKDTAEYEAQQLIVLRTAQQRLRSGEVHEDAQEDEGEQEPEDEGSTG